MKSTPKSIEDRITGLKPQKMILHGQLRWSLGFITGIVVALSWTATISATQFFAQNPISKMEAVVERANFSVGFSIQSSYVAISIIFEDDGKVKNIHKQYGEAGAAYQEVMARLSLESSQHIAPPYDDDGQYWADQPRQGARLALKTAGLPASYEVGVLALPIKDLKSQVELALNIKIVEAVFTSSHLLALYQDDMEDIAEYIGVKYITPKKQFRPILWETATVYAGHGFGMCKHWRDDEKCRQEDRRMVDETIMSVHYSRSAITTTLTRVSVATAIWEPDYRHVENFTLGSDAIQKFENPSEYWMGVRAVMLEIMTLNPFYPKPEKVFVTGDRIDMEFLGFLKRTLDGFLGYEVPIFSDNAMFVAAQGAAEFMRRGPAPWS